MALRQKPVMHARIQGGALYGYNILDENDQVVGSKMVRINKKTKPWQETATYTTADGKEWRTVEEFMVAYKAIEETKRRDAEWEAAAPKPRTEE